MGSLEDSVKKLRRNTDLLSNNFETLRLVKI